MFALTGQVITFIAKDILGSILYFPVWWYSKGAMRILHLIGREISSLARTLHLPTLFKYLLKPMYGYTDIISRIISFYVRIVQFVFLMVFTIIVVAALTVFFLIWVSAPLFILYNLGFHLGLIQFNVYSFLSWQTGLPI